jgi:NhaA family Na+:H+ antiporter
MVARAIFGPSHPAIPFLMFLAIADDALGLLILAIAYPVGQVSLLALVCWLMPALAVAYVMRRARVARFWPYVAVAGTLAWFGFYRGGLHPALALVAVVPFMSGVTRDDGGDREHDALAEFERWWTAPVQVVLLFFGLVNGGVSLSSAGSATWIVVAALLAGKPAGITLTTLLMTTVGRLRLSGMTRRDVLVIGVVAGIGFTVSLFFATAAFPRGSSLDETKMGALLSFAAAPLAFLVARILRVPRPAERSPVAGLG